MSVFEFLEKCDLANADLQLWERGLAHLMTTPDVQKAAWEFLHAKRKNKLKGFKYVNILFYVLLLIQI